MEQKWRDLMAGFQLRGWLPWIVAGGIVVGVTLLLSASKALLDRGLARREPEKANDLVADLTRRTSYLFLMALAVLAAVSAVELPVRAERIARAAALLVVISQVGRWASRALVAIIDHRIERAADADARRDHQTVARMATFGLRIVLWAVLVLVALDNLGVNITTLVTGLGVGGIAVALATQNILGDLFASVSILLDKPFVLGDFISVDDYMGTVEQIGIKTTRVRALGGEQIVLANGDLLKSRLRNYKSQRERRVVVKLTVAAEAPSDKLAAIPGLLRTIVERQIQQEKKLRFDRAHFATFGDAGLVFELVYVVAEPDFGVFMDVQQAINLDIHRELVAAGVSLIFAGRLSRTAPTS
jgi:small-conductance mechanosensitive channel